MEQRQEDFENSESLNQGGRNREDTESGLGEIWKRKMNQFFHCLPIRSKAKEELKMTLNFSVFAWYVVIFIMESGHEYRAGADLESKVKGILKSGSLWHFWEMICVFCEYGLSYSVSHED